MFAAAVFALGCVSIEEASDYFPLVTGTKWTYQDEANGSSSTYVDSVGNSQDIGGKPATPIVTLDGAKIDGSTFYRVENGQVFVVAFEQNKPLKVPYPILKVGSGKSDWDFVGITQWYGADAPMTIHGSAKRSGQREFFGAKRDVLEVILDANVGPKAAVGLKSHQVSIYAKGIGLVELKDTTTMNKNKSERKRKLISFEPGSQG